MQVALNQAPANINASSLQTTQTGELVGQHRATTPIVSKVEVAPGVLLHVEESGNPAGIPAVFFHGGPGIKFSPKDHQWFDPDKYRVIAFQQRGTWGCTPSANDSVTPSQTFKDVTIQTVAEDIEALRKHLGIEKWLVFGGSWGSALSVYYAQQYPESCSGLVLRGIYLASHGENALFIDRARHAKQCGQYWKDEALDRIVNYAKSKGLAADLQDPPTVYAAYRELCVLRDDRIAQRIWAAFEDFVDDPKDEENYNRLMNDERETTPNDRSTGIWETLMMDSVSRSYDMLDAANLAKLNGIKVQVVQGASDNLCHPSVAEKLVEGMKTAGCQVRYSLVEGGPHSPHHPGMTDALVRATDNFAKCGDFG